MADPTSLVDEFEIPVDPVGSDFPVLGGIGAKVGVGTSPASIRVRILANGDIQYYSVVEGREPKRVVPTANERAMIEQVIRSRKEAAKPPAATPTPANKLEDITDPTTGRVVKRRDPATGTVIDLPDPPPPRTPEGARIEAANATVAEANAQKAVAGPPMIRTGRMATIGPEGQQAPEMVTKDQADYDRQTASDLAATLRQKEESARADARLAIEQGRFTAEQALTEYNKKLDAIRLAHQAEINAITQRGQDISVRGQDVSAGVSQRGQDMSYEQGLAQNATTLAAAMLPNLNAPGQIASTNSLMAGGPPVATQPMGMPFDPVGLPIQAALAARAQMPAQYALPGAPAQIAPTKYQLPG